MTKMTTTMTKRAGVLSLVSAAAMLTLGIGAAPAASAADGCGFGMHEAYGRCEGNLPGPGARFDPANPGCWYNDNNDLRCY